jgi:uncharacterized protein (TIGR00251 family)
MSLKQTSWFRWQASSLILEVAIQPGASKSEIVGMHGDQLKIRIQAPPVDGKANRAITEFLGKLFATPRSRINVIRGETSRRKTVQIDSPVNLPGELLAIGLTK